MQNSARLLSLLIEQKLTLTHLRVYAAICLLTEEKQGPPYWAEVCLRLGKQDRTSIQQSVDVLREVGLLMPADRHEKGLRLPVDGERERIPAVVRMDEAMEARYCEMVVAECCMTCRHWRPTRSGVGGCVGNSHPRAGWRPHQRCERYGLSYVAGGPKLVLG